MGKIEGGGEYIPPQLKQTYKKEFTQGVNLFQQSLTEYQKTDSGPKKDQFKEVMDMAMQVMSETAKLCLGKQAQNKESTVEKDYQGYIANASPENLQKLQTDLEKLKKSI